MNTMDVSERASKRTSLLTYLLVEYPLDLIKSRMMCSRRTYTAGYIIIIIIIIIIVVGVSFSSLDVPNIFSDRLERKQMMWCRCRRRGGGGGGGGDLVTPGGDGGGDDVVETGGDGDRCSMIRGSIPCWMSEWMVAKMDSIPRRTRISWAFLFA